MAACVVFKNEESQTRHRKFNIKTVEGPDDYKSMREVVYNDTGVFWKKEAVTTTYCSRWRKGQLSAALEV